MSLLMLALPLFAPNALAQEPWRVAPIDLEGPNPRVGDFAPVDEVMTVELFGVLRLDPQDPGSLSLYERWHRNGPSRAQYPLLVVKRTDLPRLAQWLPEPHTAPLWLLEADPFVGLPPAPGAIMMCTMLGCVPAAASGGLNHWPSEQLFADDGVTLEQAREGLSSNPKLARQLLRAMPPEGRKTVAAMAEAPQLEALAIAAAMQRATLETLGPLALGARFDVECRLRSADDCHAYGRELLEKGTSEQARPVLEHACGHGAADACTDLEQLAPDVPHDPSTITPPPADDLPKGFPRASWPTRPEWDAPYLASKEYQPIRRGRDPMYPDLKRRDRVPATCYAMLLVDANGTPKGMEVAGCPDIFADQVKQALFFWRWPERSTAATTVVTVKFRAP